MGSVCTASFLSLSVFFLIVIQQKILGFSDARENLRHHLGGGGIGEAVMELYLLFCQKR